MRVQVEPGTKGAYLYAPFGDHMKAGFMSLIPIVVLNIVAAAAEVQGDPSVADRILGGLNATGAFVTTLGWVLMVVAAAYCASWAAMSIGLVRLLRFRPSIYPHLAAHALAGAVITFAVSMGLLWLSVHDELAGAPLSDSPNFAPLALGAPAIGAASSVIGMWALKSLLGWYVDREREPLKDVFTFVEGRHVKDDFKRI